MSPDAPTRVFDPILIAEVVALSPQGPVYSRNFHIHTHVHVHVSRSDRVALPEITPCHSVVDAIDLQGIQTVVIFFA